MLDILNKFTVLVILVIGIIICCIGDISAVQLDQLPGHREHIRLFRNFGTEEEIIRNNYDLSFRPGVRNSDPEHIGLSYDLNTDMMAPSEKASSLRDWVCTNKLQKPLDQCNIPETWLCGDLKSCDVPEDMFLHFKRDTEVTLPLDPEWHAYNNEWTFTVKGWDAANLADENPKDGYPDVDSNKDGTISDTEWSQRPNKDAGARIRQDARVPSYYWGNYWEYLTGEPVAYHANFALNIGNTDYGEFMSQVYIPDVLNNNMDADGIYFDEVGGFWLMLEWIKSPGIVEYDDYDTYSMDNIDLLRAIKENIPADKIIIGNSWHNPSSAIDGYQWEVWLTISRPYKNFIHAIDAVRHELSRGMISLVQFNPAYHETYAPYGKKVPVPLERDQLYALASYYLAAGEKSYFAYGNHPYGDQGNLMFEAINVDIGVPEGAYFIFSEENGQGNNVLHNGSFEIAGSNNKPDGWKLPNPDFVEIAPESECGPEGKCAKISSSVISSHSNSQQVKLKPDTLYTLSGYIKSSNVTGGNGFYGTNFYPYNFDDSAPILTGCGANWFQGTNDWELLSCTFTTGKDVDGTINFRIQNGTGTAWFDRLEMREGIPRNVLARKYSKALVLVRPRADDEAGYENPVNYKLRNSYRRLSADGNPGAPSNSVILNSGEAAILMCTQWDGYEYTTGEDCLRPAPSTPVLVSPSNGQTGLDTAVTFKWNHSVYPDEDMVTHRLSYCTNRDFSGCSPMILSSHSRRDIQYALMGKFSHFLIFGLIAGVFFRSRKNILLIFICFIMAGGMLSSCGGSGGNSEGSSGLVIDSHLQSGEMPAEISKTTSEVSYTISGLKSDTKYYWKVTVDNGKGGTAESEIWSFNTM